jgi:hypothetical protein
LAYVKIFLGALKNENTQKTQVKALHDSGCAATIINRKIFEQIPDYKTIPVNATPNTFVVSVTGEQTAIYGSATIYVTFRGANDIDLTFPHDVHIHDDIEHDFILGRDFTGSDAKILETKDHLYLTHETDTSDPEDFLLACHVPIISSPCKTYEVHSIDTVLLPPLVCHQFHVKSTDYSQYLQTLNQTLRSSSKLPISLNLDSRLLILHSTLVKTLTPFLFQF